jgi:dTDP-4-dehydrorhamnose reductase
VRVLITGGSGFLGNHLTRLLETEHEVMSTYRTRPVRFERAATLALDLSDVDQCSRLLGEFGPSHIVHAAAMTLTGECEKDPEQAWLSNVQSTQNLLKAAQALSNRPQFVFISTDLVFDGEQGGYQETDLMNPLQVYGRTKMQAEHLLDPYRGLWTVIRSALIYGPIDKTRPTFLNWMLDGIRNVTGALFDDEYRTPVYVRDLAAAIESACSVGAEGVFHCGGQERLSRYEFGLLVARAFGLPETNVRRGSSASVTTGAPRPKDVSLDITKARHDLGYSPTPTMDALREVRSESGL